MKPYRPRSVVGRCLTLTATLVVVLLSGCFDPFRVHVPAAALEVSPLDWDATDFGQQGGTFGLKITETRYVHRTDDDSSPPFPGVLQVFSLRGDDSTSRAALMERARQVVSEALDKESINVDEAKDASGKRELRNGVDTQWFLHEGTIESGGGDFFDPNTRITVRVLAEVGADGRSSTGFIAVAFVKVSEHQDGPVLGGVGDRTISDQRTWFDIVADPEGSIEGASFADSDRGLIYNLRTHG